MIQVEKKEYTFKELIEAVEDIGKLPECKKYQEPLIMIASVIQDYVKLISQIHRKKTEVESAKEVI